MKRFNFIVAVFLFLTACNSAPGTSTSPSSANDGQDAGLEQRHRAQVPDEYVNLKSPALNADLLNKGGEIYTASCASCHGDGGLGDGPASTALTPAPAPISQTSEAMPDGYLYWRIAEGGVDFGSAMPAWKNVLSEGDIWSVIAYLRALGRGEVNGKTP